MSIHAQNIQWPAGFGYLTGDRGTMALGAKEVVQPIPDTIVATENFETLPITGSGTWFVDTSNPHSGTKYLRSAIIGNSASTTYTFTVPALATTLRFWYRISSELNFDFLKIYKNSISVPNQLFSTSGTANVWTQLSLPLAGVTSVIFEYSKDSSSIGGLDLAGIDDLEWISVLGVAAVTNYEPFHLDANNCLKVSLCSNHVIIDSLPPVEIMNDIGNPVPVSFTRLNCATDSVEICNDSGNPIPVSGTVELGATTLAALETITVLQGTSPWVVSGTVSVNNFPAVANLDCATDSVTVCPGDDPIEVTVNNFPAVAHLDCATDSVTICPGDDPIEVTVNNFPAVEHLDCATDSVTICPGDDPIEVTVNNFPVVEHLDCATDSVTICPGDDPIEVTVNNFPVVAHLNCATDSVEICNDAGSPITISGTVTANQGGVWTTGRTWDLNFATDQVDVTGSTVAATQSGVWTTDRTWDLNFATDQVDASGSVITVNQGTSPWVVSGTVTSDTNFDYPEDSVHVSGNPGAFILAVRNDDPLNVLTSADGDYSPVAVTSTGRVFTTDRANFAEDTPASSGHFGEFILGVRNDTGAVKTDTDGDYSQISTDSSGRVGITDLGGSITVDGTVAVSNQNTQYAEDIPAVSGDLGNLALVMRHDASTGTVNNDGDYSALHVNQFGQLKVTIGGQQVIAVPGKRTLSGLYYGTTGPIAYTTAADAATDGSLWLVNTSNTVVVYLRTVRFTALLDSLAILTNLPTIHMERMTFTGTPSGTLVTPAKRDSVDAANTGTIRTASTGMTITAGAAIESFSPPTADVIGGLLSVNATASIPVEQLFVGDLDSFITLRQNEGIVFRQSTAGNATENRQYWLNLVWEEI